MSYKKIKKGAKHNKNMARSHTNDRLVINKLKSILTVPEGHTAGLKQALMKDEYFCDELALIFEKIASMETSVFKSTLRRKRKSKVKDAEEEGKEKEQAEENEEEEEAIVAKKEEPEGHREWLNHSLAALPDSSIIKEEDVLLVMPTPAASLRYLSKNQMNDAKIMSDKAFLARNELCDLLYDALSPSGKTIYDKIARRKEIIGLSPEYSRQGDVAIAEAIHKLEVIFSQLYAEIERGYRSNFDLPQDVPTPIEMIETFARGARMNLVAWLENFMEEPILQDESKDAKIVCILANIAANRVLIESACRTELRDVAVEPTIRFIETLNDAGIIEVPPVSNDLEIVDFLNDCFGENGRLLSAFRQKHISIEALYAVLAAAKQAQEEFLKTRVLFHLGPGTYNTKRDLLIFALGLIACKFQEIRVRGEEVGSGLVKVFPNQVQIREEEKLLPSALEMSVIIYGQIIYSNTGWCLRPDSIRSYAVATLMKRAHLQTCIFHFFKCSSASQLLQIFSAIVEQKVPQKQEEDA